MSDIVPQRASRGRCASGKGAILHETNQASVKMILKLSFGRQKNYMMLL